MEHPGKTAMVQQAMKYALLIVLLILWIPAGRTALPVSAASADHISVILVLDNSGSMKASDPYGLRFTGARMFLSLLDVGDSAGVILFSTDSVPLSDGLVTIEHENNKVELLNRIQEQPPDGFTDVRAAFLAVGEWLDQVDIRGKTAYIIFLTDGKPEISNMPANYEEETIQLAKSWNLPILSIALASAAQTPFLERLASESGGRVISADHAADLLDAYLSILSQIKDRTILTASSDDLSFFLDPGLAPYIDKASFIFSNTSNGGAHLYSPGNGMLSANDQRVRFALSEPGFIVFTVENPQGGIWQFYAEGGGGPKAYAILHSRLRIEMDAPGTRHQQSKPMLIELRMLEELADGSRVQIVGNVTFTAVITLPDGAQESLDLFYDDSTHGDVHAGDGIFSRLYVNTNQTGIYSIEVKGSKADVPVETRGDVEVIAFPRLRLKEPAGLFEFDGEALSMRVLLDEQDHFPLEGGEFFASITSPSGKMQVIQLVQEGNAYSANFLPKEEGMYQIQISDKNTMYRGLPYEETVFSQFEVKFIRTLNVQAEEWVSNGCFDERGHIPIRLRVFSPDPAIIEFSVSGEDGLQPYPAYVNLPGGSQEFILEVTTPSGKLLPGNHQIKLDAVSTAEFKVQPQPALFSFEVPGIYQRCAPVFKWGGLTGLAIVVTALVAVRKIRAGAQPALLSGTLRYWQMNPSLASSFFEHDLNLFSKTAILVGSASDCDISIANFGLDSRHFNLIAEKTEHGIQVILKPIGEVRLGYSQLHTLVVLRHGDMFRINNLNFQYLSDSGE